MNEAGIPWIREFIKWPDVQPSETSPPDFSFWISRLSDYHNHGISILVTLNKIPPWASCPVSNPTCTQSEAKPPRDNLVFYNFARAAAAQLGEYVQAYELLNEPDIHDWDGTKAEYRDLILKPGYDGIVSVAATAYVLGPALAAHNVTNPNFFVPWLEEGGVLARPLSGISLHAYGSVDHIKSEMAIAGDYFYHSPSYANTPNGTIAYDMVAANRGYWLTEFGFGHPGACPPDIASQTPGQDVTKIFEYCAFNGVGGLWCQQAFFFIMMNSYGVNFGCDYAILDNAGVPKDGRFNTIKTWVLANPATHSSP